MPDSSALQQWYHEGSQKGYIHQNPEVASWIADGVKHGYLQDESGGSATPAAQPDAAPAPPLPGVDTAQFNFAKLTSATSTPTTAPNYEAVKTAKPAKLPGGSGRKPRKSKAAEPAYTTSDLAHDSQPSLFLDPGRFLLSTLTNAITNHIGDIASSMNPTGILQGDLGTGNPSAGALMGGEALGAALAPVARSVLNLTQGGVSTNLADKRHGVSGLMTEGFDPIEAWDALLYNSGAQKVAASVPQLAPGTTAGNVYNIGGELMTNPLNILGSPRALDVTKLGDVLSYMKGVRALSALEASGADSSVIAAQRAALADTSTAKALAAMKPSAIDTVAGVPKKIAGKITDEFGQAGTARVVARVRASMAAPYRPRVKISPQAAAARQGEIVDALAGGDPQAHADLARTTVYRAPDGTYRPVQGVDGVPVVFGDLGADAPNDAIHAAIMNMGTERPVAPLNTSGGGATSIAQEASRIAPKPRSLLGAIGNEVTPPAEAPSAPTPAVPETAPPPVTEPVLQSPEFKAFALGTTVHIDPSTGNAYASPQPGTQPLPMPQLLQGAAAGHIPIPILHNAVNAAAQQYAIRGNQQTPAAITPAAQTAVPAAEVPAAAANVKTFQTAKGSTYTVHEDGTTTRDKAARSDVGHEGDSGVKQRSEATIYLDADGVDKLGVIQAQGKRPGTKILIKQDGSNTAIMGHPDPATGKWTLYSNALTGYHSAPAVGLTPLELWTDAKGQQVTHFGNKITSINAAATTTPAPTEQPAGSPVQAVAEAASIAPIAAGPQSSTPARAGRKPKANPEKEAAQAQAAVDTAAQDVTRPLTPEERTEYVRYIDLKKKAVRMSVQGRPIPTDLIDEITTLGQKYAARHEAQQESMPKVVSGKTGQVSAPARSAGATATTRIQPEPLAGKPSDSKNGIILNLQRGIGRRVAVVRGAKNRAGASGGYFPATGATQITYRGDLDALAHEGMGHAVIDNNGIMSEYKGQPTSPFDAELLALAEHGSEPPAHLTDPQAQLDYRRGEGMAEWMRAMVINPNAAQAAAPSFTAYAVPKISKPDLAALTSFSNDVRRHFGLSDTEKVARSIRFSHETTPVTQALAAVDKVLRMFRGGQQKDGSYRTSVADAVRVAITSDTAPAISGFKEAARRRGQLTASGGIVPSDDFEIREAELRYVDGKIEQMMREGVTTDDGRKLSGPVSDIFTALQAATYEELKYRVGLLRVYLISQSLVERAGHIDAEVDAAVDKRRTELLAKVKSATDRFARVQKRLGIARVTGSTNTQLARIAERASARIKTKEARVGAAVRAEFAVRKEWLNADAAQRERMVATETKRRINNLLTQEAKRLQVEYRAAGRIAGARAREIRAGGATIRLRASSVAAVRGATVDSMIRTTMQAKRSALNRTYKAGRITKRVYDSRNVRLDFQEAALRKRTGEITKQIEDAANWSATKQLGKLSARAISAARSVMAREISRIESGSSRAERAADSAALRGASNAARERAKSAARAAALATRKQDATTRAAAAVAKVSAAAKARAASRGATVRSAAVKKLDSFVRKTGATFERNRIKAAMNNLARFENTQRTIADNKKATMSGVGSGLERDDDITAGSLAEIRALGVTNPDLLAALDAAAAAYRGVANGILDYLVDQGREDPQDVADIKAKHQQYAHLDRVMTESPLYVPQGGRSAALGKSKRNIHAFKGSRKDIQDPVTSLFQQLFTSVAEADRNAVLTTFTDMLEGDETRGVLDGEPTYLADIGQEVSKETPGAIVNYKIRQVDDGQGGKVAKVVPTYWLFESGIGASLNRLGKTDVPWFLGAFRWVARIKHNMIVRFPTFKVAHFVRGVSHRLLTSRTAAAGGFNIFSIPAIIQEFKDAAFPTDAEKWEYSHFGAGLGNSMWSGGRSNFDVLQNRLLKATIKGGKGSPLAVVEKAGHIYEKLTEGNEKMARFAELRSAKRYFRRLHPTWSDLDVTRAAVHEARNRGGVDYMQGGTLARYFGALNPFTLAHINHIRNFGTWVRDSAFGSNGVGRKGLAARFLLGVMLLGSASYFSAAKHGPAVLEEYRQQPDYLRGSMYMEKVGPDNWSVIPKDRDTAILTDGVSRAIDRGLGNKQAFDGYGPQVIKSYMPLSEESMIGGAAVAPVVEMLTNHDLYRDKTIIPESENDLSLDLRRGTKHASRLGIKVQDWTGVDGRKIDWAIADEFGGFGRVAESASDVGRTDKQPVLPRMARLANPFLRESPGYNAKVVQKALHDAQNAGVTLTAGSGGENTGAMSRWKSQIGSALDASFTSTNDNDQDSTNAQLRRVMSSQVTDLIIAEARRKKLTANSIVDGVMDQARKHGASLQQQRLEEKAVRAIVNKALSGK